MKTHKAYMEELKEKDPDFYKQIIEESNQEIKEIIETYGININHGETIV